LQPRFILYPLKLTLLALALIGLVGIAQATIYTNVNNSLSALNLTADWLVAGGTPAMLPGANDTILFTGATVTTPLGGNLSVSNLTMDTGATTSMRISLTTGVALTIGSGGITKTYAGNKMELSCNLTLGANQTWTNAGNNIQVDSSAAWTFNGYTLTMTGPSTFDCRDTVNFGTNVNIQCAAADMNYGGDFNLGSGSNSFKTFTLSSGTVEGNSFPADTNAATTSAFGAGSCAFALNSGTLIYNGNTVATPEKITWGKNAPTPGNAINVSQSGQTLTLSNLVFASGATSNNFLNFGGAGNLTLIGAVSDSAPTFSYGIIKSGAGTLTLSSTNKYSGSTLVNGGTLALVGNASISNTPLISLAGGTTLDVSGLNNNATTPWVLQSSQTISNGSSATAALNGNVNASQGTIAVAVNGTAPAFSIGGGTLTVSSSTVFQINSGIATPGIYPLITQAAGGNVTGTVPPITLYRATGYLQINGGELDLVVQTSDVLNYYVSTNGSDVTGDGTLGNPWQTVAKAQTTLRTLNAQSGDIHVYLRGGYYQLTNTLTFTTADSGNNGFYMIYQSYPGESAVISGGQQVTGWTQVLGKPYWVANVPTNAGFAGYFRQLYVNGVRAERAHSGWITSTEYFMTNGASFSFSTAQTGLTNVCGIAFPLNAGLKSYGTNITDLRLTHCFHFKYSEFPVTSITTNSGWICVAAQPDYFQTFYQWNGAGYFTSPWMIVNAFEELGTPGEWYLNRATQQVYYYPYSYENMSNAVVYAPVVEGLVKLSGDSDANPVQNIRFQNLTFEYANWFFPGTNTLGSAQGESIVRKSSTGGIYGNYQPPGAIDLNTSLGIQFIGNTIAHQAACGIHADSGSQNTLIQGNIFYDSTAAAVLGYHAFGSGTIPTNTVMANNVVRLTGLDYWESALVDNLGGYGFQCVSNDMADCQYSGFDQQNQILAITNSTGQGATLVSHNRIALTMVGARNAVGDGGVIYTVDVWPGTLITGNYLYDITRGWQWENGVYLDNYSYGVCVSNNVEQLVGNTVGTIFGVNSRNQGLCSMYNLYADAPNNPNATTGFYPFYNYDYITNDVWPAAALSIEQQSGVGPAYAYLLTNYYSGTNLALGQPTWSSSSNSISAAAEDWDYSTVWHSAPTDTNCWWAVDLGAPYVIQRLEMMPDPSTDEPAARCSFQVQAANDTNFTSYVVLSEQSSKPYPYYGTGNGAINSWLKYPNDPGSYRYLRVQKISGTSLGISEFQVFGHAPLVQGTLTLGNLNQVYNGTGKAANASTTPTGLTVNFTYNASSTLPTNVGTYTVVGSISDPTYYGSATATMTIRPATPAGLVATPGDTVVTLNWSNAPGATSYNIKRSQTNGGAYTTLTNLAALTFTDTGLSNWTNYYYVVSGLAAGIESSNSAQVSATPALIAPAITGQPANCTNVAGAVATFTVTATGVPLNYFWRKNGTPLSDGGNVSGSATATLSLSNLSTADQASYSVVVSNRLGNVTSSNATLTVIAGLPVTNGLVARYDAQSITGLGDGATVTNWPDSSGNGNTATNTGGTPAYVAQGYNGLPVVRFTADGNSTFTMKTGRSDIRTVFWVCKEPSAGVHFLLGDSGSYNFHRGLSGNTIWDGTYASANIRNGTTRLNSAIVNGTTTAPGTNWNIVDVVTTGNVTASRISYDRGNAGRSWAGDVAEILIYNTALSSNDVVFTERYLNIKWIAPSVTPPTTPTNLTFTVSNNSLTLSWPANYLGWVLQAQTNSLGAGLGTNWGTVPGSSLVTSMTIPLIANNPAVFYRLMYQP